MAGGGLLIGSPRVAAQENAERKPRFTLDLVCGALGVEADQRDAIELAGKFGFGSVEARAEDLTRMPDEGLAALRERMTALDLVWGTAGLPVDFRSDDSRFEEDLRKLPALAKGLQRAGVERVSTWLMPCHEELTYVQNLHQHGRRLRAVAAVLADHGQRLGLEYVGTPSLSVSRKYPFVHSLAETHDLIAEIAAPAKNVGLVLDSWHWWSAGDSAEEIRQLTNEQVILVDLNDAPRGLERMEYQDGQRELPAATGVIDVKAFLSALVAIGYDGPIRAEPFNQPLRELDNEAACRATIEALRKAVALLET